MADLNKQELFRQFADALPIAAYIVDPQRMILYWNRAAEHVTGFLAQEVIGRHCHQDILAHCTAAGVPMCPVERCPLALTLHDGHARHAHFFLRHKAGHRVPIRIESIPLHDEEGRIIAVAELFQDESAPAHPTPAEPAPLQLHSASLDIASTEASQEQLDLYWNNAHSELAVFLIAIDHAAEIARSRGPALVHSLTQAIERTIDRMVTIPHYLGPWPGSRFLLLVPHCDHASQREIQTELDGVGNSCGVMWWGDRIIPHLHVAVARAEQHASPEALLHSLDPDTATPPRSAGEDNPCS